VIIIATAITAAASVTSTIIMIITQGGAE